MSEERAAVVFDSELEAIKESREKDLLLFRSESGDQVLWIVAVSEHQAQLAMVSRIWPMTKTPKRVRDARYTYLLEQAVLGPSKTNEEADSGLSDEWKEEFGDIIDGMGIK